MMYWTKPGPYQRGKKLNKIIKTGACPIVQSIASMLVKKIKEISHAKDIQSFGGSKSDTNDQAFD